MAYYTDGTLHRSVALKGACFFMINAYQQYKVNSVVLASPEKLLIMLYDGIIKFVNAAKCALQDGDIRGAHENIIKA